MLQNQSYMFIIHERGFKPGMLKPETCTETWTFEQSSCLKYCMLVGKIC